MNMNDETSFKAVSDFCYELNPQFPGSGRTLTNTSTLSAMWGGGGGSYPSGGMTDSGGSRESRQDLAARRLQAMSQGTETGYGTSKSPFFAGASAPPTSSDSYLISTLMVRHVYVVLFQYNV